MKHIFCAVVIVAAFAARASSAELPPPADKKVVFAEDVRPVLAKRCWSCHGETKRESGLRLDERAAATAGGDLGKVIVPGNSAASRLIQYVAGLDDDHVMPPEGDRLTAAEVGLLRAWIDQGLDWPAEQPSAATTKHWAYQPVKVGPLPAVKQAAWPRTAIDYFVLAELERRGLSPSPEADRYTLIRRLYLDLLGVPPTIAEVDAFAADERPEAYEALVDRLLASPHYGERWGRHWLDMARYADSDGYEKDNPRPDAYLFRDWVIAAINDDLPFDRFTIEQLAGDLLPNATERQRLATAFHRQTLTNTEGGTDQEQFRVEACFDRTETTGAVWLGLTVGCARCHSHKYDAVTQREYYQLFAVFNNGDERTLTIPKSAAEVAAYQIAKDKHDAAVNQLQERIAAKLKEREDEYVAWERGVRERRAAPVKLHSLEELTAKSDGNVTLKMQDDGSLLASGENPATAVYEITGRAAVAGVTAIRIDALPHDSLPAGGPGRVKHGNFVLSEVTLEVAEAADFAGARKLEFASAQADHEQSDQRWPAKNAIDGKADTGWAIGPQYGKPHWIALRLKNPVADESPRYWRVTLSQQYGSQHTLGRFKVSLQTGQEQGQALPPAVAKLLEISDDKRSEDQRKQLREHFARQSEPTQALYAELDKLAKQAPPKPEIAARTFEQRKDNPRTTYVLKRGEFLEPLKDLEVSPAGLATLPPLVSRETAAKADRLDLARWLVSPEHPLTPRVTVNHVWRMLFGRGLVRTSNDFGVRGELPSHPELLDRLAADFVGRTETGAAPWSRKALIKRIVMSATYRQQSKHRADLAEIDPQNVLLARQSRWRVEGEVVRDVSLAAAGLLSRKVGGPSVFPPLPPGVAELSYAGNFKWTESNGEDRYRRGMYTFFKRTSPHPNLTSFDCPDANLTCVERNASNTPLQALVALNNPSFVESAQGFAKRLLTAPGEDSSRLLQAFRECLGRPPREVELQELTKLLSDSRKFYTEHSAEATKAVGSHAAAGVEPREQAAWTATLRVLLNLDEFLTRE